MRYLVCLIGGALLGALLALTVSSILRQRDAWPRAVMTVMQHELGRARDLVHAGQCAAPEVASVTTHLRLMSKDIEPALLAPGAHDRVFSRYAGDLRTAIAAFAARQMTALRGAMHSPRFRTPATRATATTSSRRRFSGPPAAARPPALHFNFSTA